MRIYRVAGFLTALLLVVAVGTAAAQNYGTDARKIAMGGNGGDSANIAQGLVEKASPYTAIVLPLGLLQVFKDGFDRFKPSSSNFDPISAIEDATNPIHYTFGRGTTASGQAFVNDIRNGHINPNLPGYIGFKIPTAFRAQGLGMPEGGGTIKFGKSKTGAFQGVYFGAGPYLGFDTGMTVAQPLANMLSNGTAVACNACMVTNASRVVAAMGITLGYRGKVALASSEGTRDGVYVAYNYHILRGFQYLDESLAVRVDTNAAGQYTFVNGTTPININALRATKGNGHASDIGFVVVKNSFEVGFGINGIGNRIDWEEFTLDNIAATVSLTSGFNLGAARVPTSVTTLTTKMPTVVSESLAFQAAGWGFMGSLQQKQAGANTLGYDEKSFHGGVERKVGPLWVRGGGRYTRDKWDPTYGFGIGTKVALDFGFYGTHANLEGKRQTTMAVSVRFNHSPKQAAPQK